MSTDSSRAAWSVILTGAAFMTITMGMRQSMGLFVSPLNTATGVGIASVSLAMAIGQFVWGAAQPVAGAFADRYGAGRVLAAGVLILAFGTAITPFMSGTAGLILSLGLLTAIGSGAGSFSVLIGAAAQRMSAERRGFASGAINAGGSFGQFIFAPIVQGLISAFGWMAALWTMAVATLAALPLAYRMRRSPEAAAKAAAAPDDGGLRGAVRNALADRSYLLLHAGFFTCGFHLSFLITHLPGEVGLCGLSPAVASWSIAIIGLANIAGSLAAGHWVQRFRSKYILAVMYASRTLLVLIYLAAPKTELTFYVFAIGLGFTWLATVPPTAAVVAKLFGTRYLATLFGLTLLSHQIGGFFGAWLGGIAITQQGSYLWMWYADALLAAGAALVNLPIREAPVAVPAARPAA